MAHVVGLQVTFILAQTDPFPYSSMYASVAQVRAEKHTAHMLSARHIASKTLLAHCSFSREPQKWPTCLPEREMLRSRREPVSASPRFW